MEHAEFDPKPFVFVSNVAVFGKSRVVKPNGDCDGCSLIQEQFPNRD